MMELEFFQIIKRKDVVSLKVNSSVIALMAAGMIPALGSVEYPAKPVNQIEISSEIMNRNVSKKNEIKPREFGDVFLKEDFDSIYHQTSREFKKALTLDQFKDVAQSFNHGVQGYNLETSLPISKKVKQYIWLDRERTKGISVVFDRQHTIVGLNLIPLVSNPESDRQFTKNDYIMPIKDKWLVFWGGTNQLVNYHYATENQRYAYDLVIMKKRQTYHGDPKKNDHYYAFGKDVISPEDGKIVKVVDGIKDNVPGEMNPDQPAGNHVIIEHKNGEYSMLAHFKQDSIEVKEGEYINKGDKIGLCGNSGNSSEAHIHFQVMDSPNFFSSNSIRIRFEDSSNPIRGDFVYPVNRVKKR
ncbi:M23 family metallopeptidase [Metabacillus arenae]|uniref:Peptidoglycan DD-metalloendopeptidase family protein n=1 Tax=Metabacillus arenae TaxID=2771434 RepID=A0A926RVK7_9BACI|nr:M23 family metallopeptidase [Metabacillus arenae]MBD1378961.1 peptidoglycan DD-metalloendopeptidase family protein [Metabacillus arenae]